MGRWEHRYLGWDRFPDPSTPIEMEQLFTLEPDELACAKARRTPLHRMAVRARARDENPTAAFGMNILGIAFRAFRL